MLRDSAKGSSSTWGDTGLQSSGSAWGGRIHAGCGEEESNTYGCHYHKFPSICTQVLLALCMLDILAIIERK